jgi:hypothetical protein
MESVTLHVAARRYLMARHEELAGKYATLPNHGRTDDGDHSPEARRTFPRYHVVAAILEQVERLDPEQLPGLSDLVDALSDAAGTAESVFTQPVTNAVEGQVMAEERERFRSGLLDWVADGDLRVEPLPYRRVLTEAESAAREEQLRQRWGLVDRTWHPMLAEAAPPGVLLLAEASMWDEQAIGHVRSGLRELGGGRVTELREYGADYLLDVEVFAPRYTLVEGVWSDDTLAWIAYASHEGTVAFGGDLAAILESWRGVDRWRWLPETPSA